MPELNDLFPEDRRSLLDFAMSAVRKCPKLLGAGITIKQAMTIFLRHDIVFAIDDESNLAMIVAQIFFRRESVPQQ